MFILRFFKHKVLKFVWHTRNAYLCTAFGKHTS